MITLFKAHIWTFYDWKYGQYIITSGNWLQTNNFSVMSGGVFLGVLSGE